MDIRNPIFTADNSVDCEINHPQFGWIPFTADPSDVEAHGREIYAAAIAMGPAAYVEPPPPPALTKAALEGLRLSAYVAEADPLFFKWQAGEATEAEWKAKRQEIRDRFPYPAE
jgi:hypothetical protein